MASVLLGAPAHAMTITANEDASALASALFLDLPGLTITGATLSSPAFGLGLGSQAGLFTNSDGTYGLPSTGIALSSGNVADYNSGPNTESGKSTSFGGFDGEEGGGEFPVPTLTALEEGDEVPISFGNLATPEQQALLEPITGQTAHYDVVQLDITFDADDDVNFVSFFATFGSEEWPEYVGEFQDGFGLYVNGVNVAGAVVTGAETGTAPLAINIDHPDMTDIAGTELDGVLAPNGNPVLRFDVPVLAGASNTFTMILGDANDSILDTTIYLSSFYSEGISTESGASEFDPILPSNPADPVTGAYVIVIPEVTPGETIWIDPPVAVGYIYEAQGGNQFATVTAPSLATVADIDGYFVTVGGTTVALAAGATMDFFATFGVTPTSFEVSGIDTSLSLDPANPLAFPIGVSFTAAAVGVDVLVTPVTDAIAGPVSAVPLPAGIVLYGSGLAIAGAVGARRRRRAA